MWDQNVGLQASAITQISAVGCCTQSREGTLGEGLLQSKEDGGQGGGAAAASCRQRAPCLQLAKPWNTKGQTLLHSFPTYHRVASL